MELITFTVAITIVPVSIRCTVIVVLVARASKNARRPDGITAPSSVSPAEIIAFSLFLFKPGPKRRAGKQAHMCACTNLRNKPRSDISFGKG